MVPKIDTSKAMAAYNGAFRQLRALPGFSQKQILRAEMGSILKAWAASVKVGTKERAAIRARARLNKYIFGSNTAENRYRITVNSGQRGGFPGEVWFKTRGVADKAARAARRKAGYAGNGVFQQAGVISADGKYQPAWIHYGAADWAGINEGASRYAAALPKALRNAESSVGLGRQSVVQIAEQLNINLMQVGGGRLTWQAYAKAKAANASNGNKYQNGRGSENGDEVRGYIEGFSSLPYAFKIGLDRNLALVVMNRARLIRTAFAKGAGDSLKNIEKNFPNLINVRATESFESAVAATPAGDFAA